MFLLYKSISLNNGDIQPKHLSTKDMSTDMLTKPLSKTTLKYHMQNLSIGI